MIQKKNIAKLKKYIQIGCVQIQRLGPQKAEFDGRLHH